ncbi:MAG: hypothetical protein ACE5MM_01105 [Nitrospiraceae bacterium]
MRMKTVVAVLLVVFCYVAMVSLSDAQEAMTQEQETMTEETESTTSQFGLGAASFFLTVPYSAAKVTVAALGGIFGGFTYLFSAGNEEAARAVWDTSLRGTYVISPEHLKGNKAIRFLGVPGEEEQEAMVLAE